uniref:Methyltransferase domain-containing protein n=1 Tax=Rhizochromulina marina TaxID=1034831 RepID=A0A7S2S8E8_9STRA|mmetsp:Transcript_26586/g.77392  ORF Transcript_26586/g.77392 Transcript_26586/m.77392 type:complete len:208 (+) Transcript_26586:85-708(+)
MDLVFQELVSAHGSAEVAPYVHTPDEVHEAFLEFCHFEPSERVVEIGVGDGRLLLAALRAGVSSIAGFEIDPIALEDVSRRLAMEGVTLGDQVTLHKVDAFGEPPVGFEWEEVDTVYAYLGTRGMKRFGAVLWPLLRPGARMISVQFPAPELQPQRVETMRYKDCRTEELEFRFYEYIVPDERRTTRSAATAAAAAAEEEGGLTKGG